MRLVSDHVEVHLFRRRGRRVEFLILRRSAGRRKLPGVWQPVTGARRRGERALAAAMREVREETGLTPRRWWATEWLPAWFDAGQDAMVVLPVFAAEVAPDARVVLSAEHDRHAWTSAAVAARRFLWASQRRALAAVRDEVIRGGPLARALELDPGRARGDARPRPSTHARPPIARG